MMGSCLIKCCLILVLCFSLSTPLSASTFISDAIFGPQVVSQRRLLQALKPCPVHFEVQNYTIITSKCQAPDYSPKLCCSSFKEFACPFYKELDDARTDCAQVMFNYIDKFGKYPKGLFASECREGPKGLACPDEPPPPPPLSKKHHKNGGTAIICHQVLITAAALVLSLQFII